MIVIENAEYNRKEDKIYFKVSTSENHTFTELSIWNDKSYNSEPLDLSYLLKKTNNIEENNIFPKDLKVDTIKGVWFLRFRTNEEKFDDFGNIINPKQIVISNLSDYYNCVLNKILKKDIKNCNSYADDTCDDECKNIYYINTLLNTLEYAIQLGYYEIVDEIALKLDELCECKDCQTNLTESEKCETCG